MLWLNGYLFTASADKQIKAYQPENEYLYTFPPIHTSIIHSLAVISISSTYAQLVSAGVDNYIVIWQLMF
jgi:WD40 repeat protein